MAESAQQYLALVLSDEWVSAAIWQLVDNKVTILNQSKVTPLEKDGENEINQAVDTVLDDLGDAGLAVKNVLYVLPHHWVKDNDLIDGRKRLLKSLSQDLILDPLGFVVLSDAVVANEGMKHGLNFSGLIMTDTKNFWDLTLYEEGEEKMVERIGKSGNIPQDIQELKARLGDTTVSRILLLTSPNLESGELEIELQKALETQVETLSAEQLATLSITTGGYEVLVGAEESSETESTPDTSKKETPSTSKADAPLMNQPPAGFAPPTFAQEDNEGNAAPAQNSEETPRHQFQEPEGMLHESLVDTKEAPNKNDEAHDNLAPVKDDATSAKKAALPAFLSGLSLAKNLSFPSQLPEFMKKSPVAMIAGIVGVLLLAVAGISYFFLSQSYTAQVDIWLATQELEITDTFALGDAGTASDSTSIPATIFTEEVTLDNEVPTTGSKIIGDPATGEITIYNKTTQEKSFAAGTQVKANGVTFTLNDDVNVASASSKEEDDKTQITKPGTVNVGITAVDIGPEGNLGKKTSFTIANFDTSSYEGENENELTGGAEREIQAVSQKDVDTTVADLVEAGKSQLKEKIENNTSEDEYVFFTDQVETTDISPSDEVGTEAKFVRVSITLEGTAIRITNDSVQETAQELLSDQVSEDQMLLSESVQLTPESVTVSEDETYLLQAKISGQGVPQIQASALTETIQGVYLARAQQQLQEDSRIKKAEIRIQPSWLGWIFNGLPNDPERITSNIRIDHSK